jgi:hypothetical protein
MWQAMKGGLGALAWLIYRFQSNKTPSFPHGFSGNPGVIGWIPAKTMRE